ncbi:MAG: VOC family protein [Pseudomonadota bacterium]
MEINKLDHVNVRTAQLDVMIDWYTRVLGMKSGYRPHFAFPGAWMYAGGQPCVHLVGTDDNPGAGAEVALKLEHFAFSATGLQAFEAALKRTDEPYRRSQLAEVGIVQINVWDPDGNHIHIDFPANE